MAISLAGGAIGAVTALPGCPYPCNANPDPCCLNPGSAACEEWNGCTDAGGFPVSETNDAGVVTGSTCQLPDAGP